MGCRKNKKLAMSPTWQAMEHGWVLFSLHSGLLIRSSGDCLPSPLPCSRASLVAQTVKHLPTVWEIQVRSLGWEDPPDKEIATHSSTLAWKIPCTEEPGGLQSMGSQRVGHNWANSFYSHSFFPAQVHKHTPCLIVPREHLSKEHL